LSAIQMKTNAIGARTQIRTLIGVAYSIAIRTPYLVATVLGKTSPNTSSRMVTPAVAAITAYPSASTETAMTVASAAAAVLTRLLPNRIVVKRRSGFSVIDATCLAAPPSVFARCLSRIFCNETKATSELEKKPESSRHTKSRTMYHISMLVIVATPLAPR